MFKRVMVIMALALFAFLSVGQCASTVTSGQTVGVVIIGDGSLDFKGDDFYKIISEQLNTKFSSVAVGDDAQGKWRGFWDSRGYLSEQPPKRDDLFVFAKESNYSRVLFLVVSKPVVESSKYSIYVDIHRVTLEIRAMLVDGASGSLIGDKTTVQRDDSESSIVRAKRGALGKAMAFFAKNL